MGCRCQCLLNGAGIHELPDDLREWFSSYAGPGAGQVEENAIPEPFLGPLTTTPKAVFLALNPGQAFDFQRRDGSFADRIRHLGSYTAWAATWPYIDGDWEKARKSPNRHQQSRLKFLARWLDQDSVPASAMLAFEVYPWHSTGLTAPIRPDPAIIQRYVAKSARRASRAGGVLRMLSRAASNDTNASRQPWSPGEVDDQLHGTVAPNMEAPATEAGGG